MTNSTLAYTPFKNSPALDFLTVIQETEKAICIESQDFELCTGKKISVWLPKSALEFYTVQILSEIREYCTIKTWFRNALKRDNKTTECKVLSILSK
jgi:hypothetical protein